MCLPLSAPNPVSRSLDLSKRWRSSGIRSVSNHASIHTHFRNSASNAWHKGTAKMLQQQYRHAESQYDLSGRKKIGLTPLCCPTKPKQRGTQQFMHQGNEAMAQNRTQLTQKNKLKPSKPIVSLCPRLLACKASPGTSTAVLKAKRHFIPEISGNGKECGDDSDETTSI